MIWNYGKNSFSIQINALKKLNSFVIADDLIAKGVKVNYFSSLLKDQWKEILSSITVIGLNKLKGRLKLKFPFSQLFSFERLEDLNFNE